MSNIPGDIYRVEQEVRQLSTSQVIFSEKTLIKKKICPRQEIKCLQKLVSVSKISSQKMSVMVPIVLTITVVEVTSCNSHNFSQT